MMYFAGPCRVCLKLGPCAGRGWMDEWMRELIGVVEGEGGSGLVKVFLGIGRGGVHVGRGGWEKRRMGRGSVW